MRAFALIVGTLLVLLGGFSLLGGGFSWTEEETVVDVGPVQASAETRETFAVPPLAGAGLVVLGLGLGAYGLTRGKE